MPIQLRHNTQQQALPSAASHGVGLPVSDGGAGAIAQGLRQVAGASAQIASRLKQKEDDKWQVEAKKRELAGWDDYKSAGEDYLVASDKGDEAAQKEAMARMSSIANFEDKDYKGLNVYGDPDNEVPEKYLESHKNALFKEYQRFYHADQVTKRITETQSAYDDVLKGSLGSLTEAVIDGRIEPWTISGRFLDAVEQVSSLGVAQSSPARKKQILNHAGAFLGSIDAKIKNTTDAKEIEAYLYEGREVVEGLSVDGSAEEKKLKEEWLGRFANTQFSKVSEEGYRKTLQQIDSELYQLSAKGVKGTAEEFIAAQNKYASANIPEESRYFDDTQRAIGVYGERARMSVPDNMAEIIQTLNKGEIPEFAGEFLTSEDKRNLLTFATTKQSEFLEADATRDLYGKRAAIDPIFSDLYNKEARGILSGDIEPAFAIGRVKKYMDRNSDVSFDELRQGYGEATPPFFKEISQLMSSQDVGLPKVLETMETYNSALKLNGYHPSITASLFSSYGDPKNKQHENIREAAALMRIAEFSGHAPTNAAVQALARNDEPITPEQKSQKLAIISLLDSEDFEDNSTHIHNLLSASDAQEEATAFSLVRHSLARLAAVEQADQPLESQAKWVSDQVGRLVKIQPSGLAGVSDTVHQRFKDDQLVESVHTESKLEAVISADKIGEKEYGRYLKWFLTEQTRNSVGLDTVMGYAKDYKGEPDKEILMSPVNEVLAAGLGGPVDAINGALSWVGLGSDTPVGGSKSISNVMGSLGMVETTKGGAIYKSAHERFRSLVSSEDEFERLIVQGDNGTPVFTFNTLGEEMEDGSVVKKVVVLMKQKNGLKEPVFTIPEKAWSEFNDGTLYETYRKTLPRTHYLGK